MKVLLTILVVLAIIVLLPQSWASMQMMLDLLPQQSEQSESVSTQKS